MFRIGIDVGGTFTDFTLLDERSGAVHFHKVASTPRDPSEAIQQGIADLLRMHLGDEGYDVAHADSGDAGLRLHARHEMPANNLLLVFGH